MASDGRKLEKNYSYLIVTHVRRSIQFALGVSSRNQGSISQIIDIMYAYSYVKASYKSFSREIHIELEAICNWWNYIRDVYAEHLIRNLVRIGGVGRTVEIGVCQEKEPCRTPGPNPMGF